MQRQKVKLLLWFGTLLSVLALVVAPALATDDHFTLKVEKAGDGTGTVTSVPPGINCGAVCEATYYETFASGKLMGTNYVEVILTATPDEGFAFAGWGQDCGCTQLDSPPGGAGFGPGTETCYMTLNEDRTCPVNFGLPVGGVAVPVNRLGLLAPWMGLVTLAGLAVLGVALVKKRRSA